MLLPASIDPTPLIEAEAKAREDADEVLQEHIDAEATARENADSNKVDKLTGVTSCDQIYAKRSDGAQGFQPLWTEPKPNSIPSRDDYGAMYAKQGYGDNAVVINEQLDAEATARADGDAENAALIKALQGVGGYLTAYDFGSATPTQQALTDYALEQIGITDPLEIFNGTRVKNTYDTHVWILANTPHTDPPVFQWMDDGADMVDVPNTAIADISAEADDTVVTSGKLVNLLKSLSGRIMALLARFHATTGHKHTGTDSPKVAYSNITGTPDIPAAQVNSDWNATEGVAQILNKPDIPAAQVNSDWNATEGVERILNKPTIPAAQVNSDWNATEGVAQILNKPDIPAAQVNADWNATEGVAAILNKPDIPSPTTPEYTFIVDSNEALEAWGNNLAGNDYSHVFIKKGTWTSSIGVNLSDTGTKVVVGQGGSILNFTYNRGLSYSSPPETPDYWMMGVYIDAGSGYATVNRCFVNCVNLVNCFAYGSNGFVNCVNLVNCSAYSWYQYNCFNNCINLTNCVAKPVTSTDSANGFSNCIHLVNCAGYGSKSGYGFINCRNMLMCKKITREDRGAFSNCYMTADTSYPVANTAEGGWNVS
jgi:hypothetical protein